MPWQMGSNNSIAHRAFSRRLKARGALHHCVVAAFKPNGCPSKCVNARRGRQLEMRAGENGRREPP